MQGYDVECGDLAKRIIGRHPADHVVDRYGPSGGCVIERRRVHGQHALRDHLPGIRGRRPLLKSAPVHLCHDEALGLTPEDMRRHQIDGLPARRIGHHRPQPLDPDREARGDTLAAGKVLGHRRDLVSADRKLWRLEHPPARFGIAPHPTREHAVDRHAHLLTGLCDPAECRRADDCRSNFRRRDSREVSDAERWSRRRSRHDLDHQRLGEFSKLARRVYWPDGDRMLACGEGSLWSHRVCPPAIGDVQRVAKRRTVDVKLNLACWSKHTAGKRGRRVIGYVVCF